MALPQPYRPPGQPVPGQPVPGQPAPATSILPMAGNPAVLTAAPQPGMASTAGRTWTPAAAPTAPPRPPAVTNFGPGDDLRFTQFNPVANRQEAEAQQMAHGAAQQLSNVPNREELATGAYDRMAARDAENLGKEYAAYGKTGSGTYNRELDRRLAMTRADLAANAAGMHMQDYLAKLEGLKGYGGQQFAMGQGRRDELRGERNYQYGVGRDAQTDQLIRAQMLGEQAAQQGGAAQGLIQEMARAEAERRRQQQPAMG